SISRVQAIRNYMNPDCRFLNFRSGDVIFVYHKLSGKRDDLWAGTIGKRFGYFPKDAVEVEETYATKEVQVPTKEHDFFCLDGNGAFIESDSSHWDSEEHQEETAKDETESPEASGSGRGSVTEFKNSEGIAKGQENGPAVPHTTDRSEEPKTVERGGSYWLGSGITGWLGIRGQEDDVSQEEKEEQYSFRSRKIALDLKDNDLDGNKLETVAEAKKSDAPEKQGDKVTLQDRGQSPATSNKRVIAETETIKEEDAQARSWLSFGVRDLLSSGQKNSDKEALQRTSEQSSQMSELKAEMKESNAVPDVVITKDEEHKKEENTGEESLAKFSDEDKEHILSKEEPIISGAINISGLNQNSQEEKNRLKEEEPSAVQLDVESVMEHDVIKNQIEKSDIVQDITENVSDLQGDSEAKVRIEETSATRTTSVPVDTEGQTLQVDEARSTSLPEDPVGQKLQVDEAHTTSEPEDTEGQNLQVDEACTTSVPVDTEGQKLQVDEARTTSVPVDTEGQTLQVDEARTTSVAADTKGQKLQVDETRTTSVPVDTEGQTLQVDEARTTSVPVDTEGQTLQVDEARTTSVAADTKGQKLQVDEARTTSVPEDNDSQKLQVDEVHTTSVPEDNDNKANEEKQKAEVPTQAHSGDITADPLIEMGDSVPSPNVQRTEDGIEIQSEQGKVLNDVLPLVQPAPKGLDDKNLDCSLPIHSREGLEKTGEVIHKPSHVERPWILDQRAQDGKLHREDSKLTFEGEALSDLKDTLSAYSNQEGMDRSHTKMNKDEEIHAIASEEKDMTHSGAKSKNIHWDETSKNTNSTETSKDNEVLIPEQRTEGTEASLSMKDQEVVHESSIQSSKHLRHEAELQDVPHCAVQTTKDAKVFKEFKKIQAYMTTQDIQYLLDVQVNTWRADSSGLSPHPHASCPFLSLKYKKRRKCIQDKHTGIAFTVAARTYYRLAVERVKDAVSSLPEDMRPGPDLYGLPWEAVVLTAFLGGITVLMFFCRSCHSIKSRLYVGKERKLGEKVAELLEEKCKVLETLSECKRKYENLETTLKNGGLSEQATEKENLQVMSKKLEQSNAELKDEIERLKQDLDSQKATRSQQGELLAGMQLSLKSLEEEARDVKSQMEQAQTTLKVYDINSERLKKNIQTALEENSHLHESESQLAQEAEGWEERLSELAEELKMCESSRRDMQADSSNKEEQIKTLTDCLLKMKDWDSELEEEANEGEEDGTSTTENGDLGTALKQKVQKLIYAARMNADLKSMEEEKNRVFARLADEVKTKEDLRDRIGKLQTEKSSLQVESAKYTGETQKLQQKLQIMTEMYQENELKLHRKLTVEEKERLQKEQKLTKADEKISLAAEELNTYRQRAKDLEEELERTYQAYKNQISSHEKKAHDNWLAARAADRDLADIKRENSHLRQKLTDAQFRLELVEKDPYALDVPGRPLFRGERSPFGPSPLGRPSSETRAFLSPPTLLDGPARLSPQFPGGPGGRASRGPPVLSEGLDCDRILENHGSHSDSGSLSPTWERDRRVQVPPPGTVMVICVDTLWIISGIGHSSSGFGG
ncbi:CTGE5 factor, partial [Atractosteus spatula]|nr:CTGE5 factor [Atractosteus spatula]